MHVTHAGLVEIESSEGFSSRPYLDRVARPPVWTQGFGETKNVGPNSRPLSRAEAEKRLTKRFGEDYAWALAPFCEHEGFTQNMYDALASFIWNCGPGAVGPDTTIGKRLRARDWAGAADALLAWNKSGGRPVEGLTLRRQRERKLFLTPVGHPNAYYLTKWERQTVDLLDRQRQIAARNGGWDKVDSAHLKKAARAKADLRKRVALLAHEDAKKSHRSQRIAALRHALASDS